MIFIDLDEVLFPFIAPCCTLLRERHNISIEPHQVNTFDWYAIPGAGISQELWYDVLNSWEYKHEPFPGAIEFTKAISNLDKICYITARAEKHREDTERQLQPFASGELILTGKSKHKLDIIASRRSDQSIIIDDHPITTVDCAEMGLWVYLMHRPVNHHVSHKRIIRVSNYDQIIHQETARRYLVSDGYAHKNK